MKNVGVKLLQQRCHKRKDKASRHIDHRIADVVFGLQPASAADIALIILAHNSSLPKNLIVS